MEHLGDADGVLIPWWTRPAFSRRETSRRRCSASPVGHGGTGRELSDWGIPGLCQHQRENSAGPGVVPAPGLGGAQSGEAAGGRRAGGCVISDQAQAWPGECWSGHWNLESPSAGWTGDAVYGSDRNLRLWLERAGRSHVLAIKRSEKLGALTEKGPRQVRADRLASQVDGNRLEADHGQRGRRMRPKYGRGSTILGCFAGYTALAGTGHGATGLLVRRSLANPGELAYYV